MGRRRQETDSNGQEEAADRQEWAGGGWRKAKMGRRQAGIAKNMKDVEGKLGKRRVEMARRRQDE
jgi:hypothetical protein